MTTVVSAIALMVGAGWASGINLYATILALGLMRNSRVMVLASVAEDLAENQKSVCRALSSVPLKGKRSVRAVSGKA